MRRYTATEDELKQYVEILGQLAEIKPKYQELKARLAEWESAHGEDVPDVPQ